MSDPLVIVVPQREGVLGANNLRDQAQLFEPMPLSRALETAWPTYAHHSVYTVPGEAEWPRINKAILPDIVAAGGKVEVAITALDWDMPGHAELTDQAYETVRSSLPLPPTYLFKTKHGVRLLFVHQPLEPHDAEALHRALHARFADAGLVCDSKVWDWTRVHGLPRVVRDGRVQSPDVLRGPLLDASTIPRKSPPPLPVRELDLARPQEPDARALVFTPGAKGLGLTEWAKEAKKALGSRMDGHLEKLFDHNPPPIPTPRNPTIMKWAGCASAILTRHVPNSTPEHLYGLLIRAVNASLSSDGRDLPGETWKMILYCWGREEVKRSIEKIEQGSLSDRIAAAMKKWPDPAKIPEDERNYIAKRLIVSAAGKYYVLQADGQYSRDSHPSKHLFAALRDSGLAGPSGLVDLYGEDGDASETFLLNYHHTPLENTIDLCVGPGRAWVHNNRLKISAYRRRTDMPATFSKAVDEWLRALGGAHYRDLCRWIGLALAIERGPICALSLVGPPASGKQMFADGLGECFDTECVARASDFGTYQYGLAKSPVVVIDEGWPDGVRNVADTFRRLVGGTCIEINRKYEPIQLLSCNPRILLTANNLSLVNELFSRKQMDVEDQQALAQRLHHVNLTHEAARHLAKKGGRAHTAGWVKGDIPSRYTIAMHFLWLYEQHGQEGGAARFLFEGRSDPVDIWRFGLGAENVSDVGQALLKTIQQGKAHRDLESGLLWVSSAAVQDQYQVAFERKISLQKTTAALKPFLLPSSKEKFLLGDTWQRGRAVNEEKLREFAEEHGLTLSPAKVADLATM